MAWAKCPTHGPIQDATEANGKLWCRCNMQCSPYAPEGWRDNADLEGVMVGDNLNEGPQSGATFYEESGLEPADLEEILAAAKGEGGWYTFEDETKVQGRAAALRYLTS